LRNRVLDVVSTGNRLPPHRDGPPSTLSLSRGDVILSINRKKINDRQQCLDAVRDSGETMEFTVRDSRDGTVWRMKTTLRSTGQRFGVEVDDAPGGGAFITGVEDGYPATRNTVLDKVEDAGHGPTDAHTNWSARKYHPEVGDRIVGVNGQRIGNMQDFIRAVKSSPTEITLRIIDHKTGSPYLLRTLLNPVNSPSRLGIEADDSDGEGVEVQNVYADHPGNRCQRAQ